MNKQQLASKIWESANKMRSKIEANEYKDYILGFIFYKFLSETELMRLKASDFTDEQLPQLTEDNPGFSRRCQVWKAQSATCRKYRRTLSYAQD